MNAFITIIILVSTISLKFHFASTVGSEDLSSCLVVTPRQELCLDNIYRDLKCKRPKLTAYLRSRLYLPKKVFDFVDFYKLETNDAKNYLMYIHNLITTVVRRKEPIIMLNPLQFCEEATREPSQDEITSEYEKCKKRLSDVYSESTNTTEILKHAFLNLVISTFKEIDDYALDYYNHIKQFFGFNVETKLLNLPEDFCIGPLYRRYIYSLLPRKRELDSDEAGSTKSKKAVPKND